jgi:hypothetical protein
MSALLLLALLQIPAPSPCSAPEYRQFDFWVGDWVVHNPKGQQVGTNRIEKVENGCGLQESWASTRGGYTGRSINSYRPSTGQWHQTWLGNDGGLLLLDGKFADGRMVLEGTGPSASGSVAFNRITWSRMEGGIVRQLWEQSTDGGKTWSTSFDGRYSPRRSARTSDVR